MAHIRNLLLRRAIEIPWTVVKRLGLKETALRFSYQDGTPPSLDPALLNTVVRDVTGSDPSRILYRQMSGWKKSGAYRLVIRTHANDKLSFIYKNALYSKDEIPALQGLPIQPGIGEYLFLKHTADAKAEYLPTAFHAIEVETNLHFQYIMEDLSGQFRTFINEADRDHLCAALPEIHQSFESWFSTEERERLLRMDRDFADRLIDYAHESLTEYRTKQPDQSVDALLADWPQFSAVFRRSADTAYGNQPLMLIHGDCNASNILFHRKTKAIKLIDLEWAGWGFPHHDLVSILRGIEPSLETQHLKRFSSGLGPDREDLDREIFRHCGLQRALLNAAFVGKQLLNADDNGPQWFASFVNDACGDALRISRSLAQG